MEARQGKASILTGVFLAVVFIRCFILCFDPFTKTRMAAAAASPRLKYSSSSSSGKPNHPVQVLRSITIHHIHIHMSSKSAAAATYAGMPPQQQPEPQTSAAAGGRSRARRIAHRTRNSCVAVFCNTLCSVLLAVILVAGVALFVAWLSLRPHRPRFTLTSFSLSGPVPGGQAAFNVSDRNPNRHIGIYYDGATRASLRFYDALVASGPAFPARWYQPNMTTVSVAGVLDVVGPTPADPAAWHSFSAALQAGRLPLRLELTFTGVRFRVSVFHSGRQTMHVKCDLLVGADGNLLSESVGASCDRYF